MRRVEIAELVLKYVQALIWPLVTLILVWSLRAHLQAAFARMTRVETPAGAIEFAAEARDVLHQAESVVNGAEPSPWWPGPAQVPAQWAVPPGPAYAGTAPDAPGHGSVQEPPAPAREEQPEPVVPGGRHEDGHRGGHEDGHAGDYEADWTGEFPEDREPPPWNARMPGGPGTPSVPPPVAPPPPYGGGYGYPGPPVSRSPPPPPASPPAPPPWGTWSTPVWRQELVAARDLADTYPREAVLAAWSTLERLCREAATAAGFPLPQPANIGDLHSALIALGLPAGTAGVLSRLSDLRNRAAHLRDVTPVAARDFVDGCLTVAREIAALPGG